MSEIRNDQFTKIYEFLRHCSGVCAGKEDDCRRFIVGVHWITRTGVSCQSDMVTGIASTNALPAGVTKGFGRKYSLILPMTPIWRI